MGNEPKFHEIVVPSKASRKFLSHKISQTPEFMMVFNEIFSREKFDRVIEIGTFLGGFSLFLAFCCLVKNMKFFTFDIKMLGKTVVYKRIRQLHGRFEKLDVFSPRGLDRIRSLIQLPGRVMLLCDGGNKPKEIQTFAKFLKRGDVIMGHDYFPDRDSWKRQKKWRCCQLTDADIAEVCKAYNLVPFYEHILAEVFWVGRIKK